MLQIAICLFVYILSHVLNLQVFLYMVFLSSYTKERDDISAIGYTC